jgi:hypothetical protein
MKRLMSAVLVVAAITLTLADTNKKEIIAFTPLQVRWFTPSYYTDGRERAQLFGDSSQGGAWVDRVKIPAGKRVLARTHPRAAPCPLCRLLGNWQPRSSLGINRHSVIGSGFLANKQRKLGENEMEGSRNPAASLLVPMLPAASSCSTAQDH